MVAVCDDILEDIPDIFKYKKDSLDPYTLFARVWSEHDTGHLGVYPVVAVSFHVSEVQRNAFHNQLYDSYERKWGVRVPPTYYASYNSFGVVAFPELYEVTSEIIRLNRLGVVVIIPNLKYLPRLGLTKQNADMDRLIAESEREFVDHLMTQRKVLDEIKDDTLCWYRDLDSSVHDTGWVEQISDSSDQVLPMKGRHLKLVRDD